MCRNLSIVSIQMEDDCDDTATSSCSDGHNGNGGGSSTACDSDEESMNSKQEPRSSDAFSFAIATVSDPCAGTPWPRMQFAANQRMGVTA